MNANCRMRRFGTFLRAVSLLSIFGVAIAGTAIAQDEETSMMPPEQVLDLFNRLAQASNGRFILGGEVMGEDGQRLAPVTVEIERYVALGVGESRKERETRTIHGSFNFDFGGCGGVLLAFKATGHYERKLQFVMRPPSDTLGRLVNGEEIPPLQYTTNDLRVVLGKIGRITELIEYSGVLEYTSQNRGTVLNFDLPQFRGKALQYVENVLEPSQLPDNCVYIVADRDDTGLIATTEWVRPFGGIRFVFPQRVTLIMNDPDGGFVPFAPALRKNHYQQMRQAPETGYQRQLVVDANYFTQTQGAPVYSKDNDLHFFFKTGGKYGKGSIGNVVVGDSRLKVLLGVKFHLQPDGSTNLETAPSAVPVTFFWDDGVASSGDTVAPVIQLLGDNPATIECGSTYTDAGATATDDTDGDLTSSITVSNAVNAAAVGQYTVTYTVSDAAGNPASATRTVNVVDTTAPQISCPANISVGCHVALSVPVSFSATATDSCDTNVTVVCVPVSGSGFRVGTTNVVCKAYDASGNTNTCSFVVTRAALGFTGFLAPIGGADATGGNFASPIRTFKLGSKIPVKFTASCNGAAVDSGLHTLQVIKWSNQTTAETPIDASPADAATTGNQFRLSEGQWIYILDTAATAMTKGTWELRATSSDGTTHSAFLALK